MEVIVEPVADEPLPGSARVRIAVLDTSRVDAPSTSIAERVVHPRGGRIGPVAVSFADTTSATPYIVRVHVDLSGDGGVAPGDWVSTAAHPVVPPPGVVTVPLTRV